MSLRDFDRGLNDRGLRGAALMGDHIEEYGAKWDCAIASPAQRIKSTLIASGLDVPITYRESAYLADSSTLLSLLEAVDPSAQAVLIAAHNPGLQELALELVSDEAENDLFNEVMAKFPTASFAVLELDINDWKDVRRGCGRITHFARPRDLDPDLGPMSVG